MPKRSANLDEVEVAPRRLRELHGLSEAQLVALASSIVAPGKQRRMTTLLRRNARGDLRDDERRELDTLLEDGDRVALLKAKANYTLAQIERR